MRSSRGSSGSSSDTKSDGEGSSNDSSESEDTSNGSSDDKSGNSGNGGSSKSSITDVYLTGTKGLLDLPGKITSQSSGVSFSIGAKPANLPVGKPYDFYATAGASSNAPVVKNGVNAPGEYVSWTFALQSGATYEDVTTAIDSGTLRIGVFAPGSSGGSSSFINSCGMGASCGKTPAVPLPASLWLMVGALGSLAFAGRRGRKAQLTS